MKPRRPAMHKARNDQYPEHKQERLLTERSALILTMAVLAAIGGADLLYVAHRPVTMIVFTAVGVFAAALRLLNDLIG